MTDFEWDQFGFVPQGTRVENIEEVFGETIVRGQQCYADSTIFVFMENREVINAFAIEPQYFDNQDALKLFDRDVRIGFEEKNDSHEDLMHLMY